MIASRKARTPSSTDARTRSVWCSRGLSPSSEHATIRSSTNPEGADGRSHGRGQRRVLEGRQPDPSLRGPRAWLEGACRLGVGRAETVFHEIVSDIVHIDVHLFSPTERRPAHTLVTTGMSDRAMTAPPGREEYAHAELMVTLPLDWQLSEQAFQDER